MATITPFHKFEFMPYDADYDETVLEEFEELLESNPHLIDIDYIAVDTGYTDRIYNSDAPASLLALLDPAVVYTDKHWAPELEAYVKDDEAFTVMNQLFGSDAYRMCVFNEMDARATLDKVELLGAAGYCGFCILSSIMSIEWYKINNKVVVVCSVDCESG